ncbi:MAG: c-type cytochrome [Calothrix sp. MO_167.B42]|nr:c-type cytochrome [Calothrix sp. MO_167.B42]
MKKIISLLLLSITVLTFAFSSPAFAADAAAGKKIFKANCASCHARGKNLVKASKNLKKETLEKYDMYSAEAIINQVTKGKGAMPAFGKKLKPEQIENVAAYVLEQADNGWKKK